MPISITDPIGQAIARSKFITFQPFNIAKWFTLGFIVFLAMLDEGGGNTNYRSFRIPGTRGGTVVFPPPTRPTRPTTSTTGPFTYYSYSTATSDQDLKGFVDWISTHVGLVILIAVGGTLLAFALYVLILWINCRAKFVLLESIANDTFRVVEPWKRLRPLGDSLFGFRAALAAISFGIFLLIALIGFFIALPDIRARSFGGPAIAAILLSALIMVPVGITIGLIDWVTRYFITHIMFATGQTTLPAWREFRQSVLPGNRGRFVLFFLMQLVLAIAVAVGQMIIGCATCCIGLLPYLSSVAALPLHIFMRSYPIYFLQQFSPRYQIITEPPGPSGFPVLPLAGPGGFPPPPIMPPGSLPPPSMPPPQIPPYSAPRY